MKTLAFITVLIMCVLVILGFWMAIIGVYALYDFMEKIRREY